MITFERLSTRARPQPVRWSNEARGENLSATRRIWAMSPPLIRRVADKLSPRASFDHRTGWGRVQVDSLSNVVITSLPAETGTMPDVRGMGLKDALFVLESRGLKVRFSGRGAVVRQSVAPGARITPGATVAITLN